MPLGAHPFQIFVTVAVILSAAFVALICDFLKRNNEHLREVVIELKVRREEEQKRSLLVQSAGQANLSANTAGADSAEVEPVKAAAKAMHSTGDTEQKSAPNIVERSAARPAAARLALPEPGAVFQVPPRASAMAVPAARKRTIAPEALAAMERGAQLAGVRRKPSGAEAEVRSSAREAASQETHAQETLSEGLVPERLSKPRSIHQAGADRAITGIAKNGRAERDVMDSQPSQQAIPAELILTIRPAAGAARPEANAPMERSSPEILTLHPVSESAGRASASRRDWGALLSRGTSSEPELREQTPLKMKASVRVQKSAADQDMDQDVDQPTMKMVLKKIVGTSDASGQMTAQDSPFQIREDLLEALSGATYSLQGREQAPVQASSADVPAGFHDGYVLNQLVRSRKPVTGLVVSIGVKAASDPAAPIPEAVRQLIHSLIGASDFACQTGRGEFLLIYPSERGASAQQRLGAISQRLWDFQLRSLGEAAILFSWGGVEVSSESIDEAIASASERMQETMRARKVLHMEPGELKQAV